MTTRKINGNTYSEFAVVAGDPLPISQGLLVPPHDYISLSYSAGNLAGVVYKTGGSGGTTVATLTLTYDGSGNLLTVTKS
jgi:hypothetical protein